VGVKQAAKRPSAADPGKPEATRAAILKVVDAENPPLRIFFGKAPLGIAERDDESRVQTWREWQPVSEEAHGSSSCRALLRSVRGVCGARGRLSTAPLHRTRPVVVGSPRCANWQVVRLCTGKLEPLGGSERAIPLSATDVAVTDASDIGIHPLVVAAHPARVGA